MASTINATPTSSGLIQTADSTGVLALQTGGTTAVTVDGSQNVGIGTSSPSSYYANKLVVLGTGDTGITVAGDTTATNYLAFADGSTDSDRFRGYLAYSHTNNALLFASDATERMRIDSAGNLLVGTTGISTGTFKGIQNAAGGAGANFLSRNSSGTAGRQWNFGMNGSDEYVVYGHSGTTFNTGAYIAWGGTSWTAQSDERSKDIIEPITDAVNKVATLRAVIGKYKTDEEGTRRSFLIAQDVQAVLPEAVDASKPDNLGVQYTEVIPLLVAAIKELNAKVDAQATTITALEARLTALENT
jgi:hypothetical protein